MFETLLLAAALAADLDPASMLKTADAPRQAFLHSTLRMRATIEQPGKARQTGEFDLYLGSEDQQLVVFRDKRQQGRKFLMIGDKAWLMVPGAKNPVAVTPNQRMMGAMSFTDIARVRLATDYTANLRPGMDPCGEPAQPCRVLEITATNKAAPYASGTLWIDGDGLLRKAVYALASGKPAKEIGYRYRDNLGQLEPAGMTLVDLLMPGTTAKTTLEYLARRPTQHPPSTFDPEQQVKR